MIRADRRGLASRRNRRGLTPFVTFRNFSGHISAKSRSVVWASSRDCSPATPLTAKLPATARFAIRTRRSGSSWISDIRATRPSSPGYRARTSSRKR